MRKLKMIRKIYSIYSASTNRFKME